MAKYEIDKNNFTTSKLRPWRVDYVVLEPADRYDSGRRCVLGRYVNKDAIEHEISNFEALNTHRKFAFYLVGPPPESEDTPSTRAKSIETVLRRSKSWSSIADYMAHRAGCGDEEAMNILLSFIDRRVEKNKNRINYREEM